MTTPPTPVLDFSRVRYENDPPAPDACKYCGRGIEGEYYRIKGTMTCAVCAGNVKALTPEDNHRAYVQALLWGIPAAVLGMVLYAGFEIVTGISIGYLAIGVGYLIAKAMNRGSGGRGGRRYQWTAVLLTYAAVAIAFIPMVIVAANREHHKTPAKPVAAAAQNTPMARTPEQQKTVDGNNSRFPFPGDAQNNTASPQQPVAPTPEPPKEKPKHGWFFGIAMLLGLGLISPFYELTFAFAQGLIGLLILFWGMRAAWQLTAAKAIPVDGPFSQPEREEDPLRV